MRPDVVVVVAPDGQLAPGVGEAVEQLLIQELVAQRPIERFNERILLRLAGIDVVPRVKMCLRLRFLLGQRQA